MADQRVAEAIFLNSELAEADYRKNSGCPPLLVIENLGKTKQNKNVCFSYAANLELQREATLLETKKQMCFHRKEALHCMRQERGECTQRTPSCKVSTFHRGGPLHPILFSLDSMAVKPEERPAACMKLGQESSVRSSGIITLSV